MLVIPLGPEDREVRRWPWVTIGIVALNVFVFVLDSAGQDLARPVGVHSG